MQQEETIPSLPSWRICLAIVAAFFSLTAAVYGHSVRYDFVRWDDGMLVYENPAIRTITPRTIAHIFSTYDPELYIPLTFFTYQLEFQIAGQHAWLYHLDNIILHTLNAICVASLAYFLLKRGWVAIFCGLLFALHPLHTEAVEWVSARKDLLSTLFFLLAFIQYLRWRDAGWTKTYAGSLIFFSLGLMSKVMIITLPVVLILTDILRGRKWSWEMLKDKIPYLGLSILFGLIGVFGKTGVIQSSTLTGKILMACKSTMFYLQKIFVPVHFSLLYPFKGDITLASPDFYVPVILIVILIALAFVLRKKVPMLAYGFAFFLITVAPTFINFAKGGDLDVYFASDRYAYVPSIGIFLLIGSLLATFFDRSSRRQGGYVLAGVIIASCAWLGYRQSLVWADTQSLFTNVIVEYPETSHVAYNNLGNAYRLQQDYDTAIEDFQKSIGVKPNAKAYSNLGAVYVRQKKYEEARAQFAKALEIQPTSKEGYFGIGLVNAAEGKYPEAEAAYRKAAALDPGYEQAFTNVGTVLFAQQKTDEAIVAYHQALAINPYFPDAQYNLGVALTSKGLKDQAIDAYERTVEMVPAFIPARINLGLLYAQTDQIPRARAQFEAILQIDPQNRAARSALQQIGAAGG